MSPTGEGQLTTLNLSDEKDIEWFHGLKHILLAFVFTREEIGAQSS